MSPPRPVFVPVENSPNLYRPVLYVSGPMAMHEDRNHPLFNEAAADLRAHGWTVINPAENFGGSITVSRHKALATDVYQLITYCRAIAFLPGWFESEGAKLEAQISVDRCYDLFGWTRHGGLQRLARNDIKEMLDAA